MRVVLNEGWRQGDGGKRTSSLTIGHNLHRWSDVSTKPAGWFKNFLEEEIIANEASDKGLISKIYKQLMQLNIRKTNNPTKNEWKPKQTFLQRRHTDGQQAHEKKLNITHY